LCFYSFFYVWVGLGFLVVFFGLLGGVFALWCMFWCVGFFGWLLRELVVCVWMLVVWIICCGVCDVFMLDVWVVFCSYMRRGI